VWTSSLASEYEHRRHYNRELKGKPNTCNSPFSISTIDSKVLCLSIFPFRYFSGSSQFFIINHPMLLCCCSIQNYEEIRWDSFYLSTSVIELYADSYLSHLCLFVMPFSDLSWEIIALGIFMRIQNFKNIFFEDFAL
jgi:hypothetical protein